MPDKRRPGQKSYELRQPEGMRYAGRPADSDLAESLLKMIAVGVAGGIALIAGAKKLGEELQDIQEDIASKYKEQREAYKQAVRAAVANEIETEYETGSDSDDPTDDLILTPSPLDEQPESVELILESSVSDPLRNLHFEGQEEAENRIEKAMAAYDAAMDDAAK